MHAYTNVGAGNPNMGLATKAITVRSVALALLLLVVPFQGMPVAEASAIDPADLLDIEPEELVLPEATAWSVEDVGPPLVMKAQARPSRAPDELALPIAGIEVFGYEATVTGGALVLLVDGHERQRLGPGTHTKDIALSAANDEMVWRFVPGDADDAVRLVLRGARAVVAPVLGYFSSWLYSDCGAPPELYIQLRFAAPLVAGSVSLTVGEEAVEAETRTWIAGDSRTVVITAEAPRLPDGTPAPVRALAEDVNGVVWDLLGGERTVRHTTGGSIGAGPHGWVYDLRPTIAVASWCIAEDLGNVRFWLDGAERTEELERCANGAQWTFPHELAFNETHAWRFEVTLLDGSKVVREGELREGFDVLELDVPSLALLWTEGSFAAEETRAGKVVFANLADLEGLPPVYTDSREPLGDGTVPPMLFDGAHLRAVYAPLGVLCEMRWVSCSPYLGEAPGFTGEALRAADLTITAPSGAVTVLPGAGQFAAASHMTVVGEGLQQYARHQANWTHSTAAWLQERGAYNMGWTTALALDEAAWARGYAEGFAGPPE